MRYWTLWKKWDEGENNCGKRERERGNERALFITVIPKRNFYFNSFNDR